LRYVLFLHVSRLYPDCIIATSDGIVPVEIKSGHLASGAAPFNSHTMQLACYCLLCEKTMKENVKFGLLIYGDRRAHKIEFTRSLRQRLLTLLKKIRKARHESNVPRNHLQPKRCQKCGFRYVCGEALTQN
jgi:CRISPR-associated protein Cas4